LPSMVTRPTPLTSLSFWAKHGVGEVIDLFQRQRCPKVICKVRMGVRRVHLVVHGRVRHVLRQDATGSVDRGLHVLGSGVDVTVEVKFAR